jgi:hypothetical protein
MNHGAIASPPLPSRAHNRNEDCHRAQGGSTRSVSLQRTSAYRMGVSVVPPTFAARNASTR